MPRSPLDFPGFQNPNYTQVPDELFDQLMPELTDAELRVLLYVVRRTFGFKRQSDTISLSQMVEGITTREGVVLDRGTGLTKSPVVRALRGLKAKGVIVAARNASPERGHEATTYRLRFLGEALPPCTASGTSPLGPAAAQALDRRRSTQETGAQETDGRPFELRTAKTGKTDEDEELSEQGSRTGSHPAQPSPSGSAGAGEPDEALRAAESPQDAPDDSVPAIHQDDALGRVLDDPTAESGHAFESVSELTTGEGIERLRATMEQIREKAAEERGAREQRTGRRHAEPELQVAAAVPAAGQREDPSHPAKRGRSPGDRDERQQIAAYLGDWLPQFNDQAPQSASITRAYNALTRANVPPERWGDYLHEAKAILREHQANVTTKADKHTNAYQPKNLTPYYFAVLEDLLGVRPAHAASVAAQPARPDTPTGEDRTQIGFGDKTDPGGRATPMLRSMP